MDDGLLGYGAQLVAVCGERGAFSIGSDALPSDTWGYIGVNIDFRL